MASKKPSKADKPAGKPGRPSAYTAELAQTICDQLSDGLSMRQICGADDMPDRRTVERWMAADEEFAAMCARAREEQAEFHHDEMDDIERKTLSGEIPAPVANVVLANKRWRMEKLKPKVYGQRQQIEHSGEMGIKHSGLSDAERVAEIAQLLQSPDILSNPDVRAALKAKA